ncbi:adenylyl-sulfate kinase [Desulfovibrio mangrovi]|uniref:adenylyl-sulfate kinase n=1 Tax=Desulfovibrio mangrovi TaxID=2976983 RepID=UPI0022470FC7|nr:adenylyl-sulfate kinase [Desulfovibrio mangrovi]UZP66245.1 adenylyl-sulfate kinase [Desulfovibrio mangrovi]
MAANGHNIIRQRGSVSRNDRERRNGHSARVFWLTGLSGSGKSTIAHAVEKALFDAGMQAVVFDGDNVRHGLCCNIGFSPEDRQENIRRISEVCKLFAESGIICLCAFIAPREADREIIRSILGEDLREIYVSCPLSVCEARDVKGYYARARAGLIKNYTGINAPYDVPVTPHLVVDTDAETRDESVAKVFDFVMRNIGRSDEPMPDMAEGQSLQTTLPASSF